MIYCRCISRGRLIAGLGLERGPVLVWKQVSGLDLGLGLEASDLDYNTDTGTASSSSIHGS